MARGYWLRGAVIGGALAGSALLTAYAVGRRPEARALTSDPLLATPATSAVAEHWDLPVKRTERVDYWEGILTGPRHEKMKLWLEQSGRYVPMIHRELRARGMPEDLVYLAFIESGFSPDAYSRTRAVGLWQFMEGTGRELGLSVTPYVDQRRDPIAATDAALDFLKDLHNQFGSWWLAAAAYNCGPNRVARVLREVTGKSKGDDETYWLISSHLPKETQDYVPLLLAAGEIAKDPTRFGFDDLDYHAPLRFDSVKVPGGTRLATVSRATGADSALVRQLNPHYVRSVTPPVKASEWIVRIPQGLTQAFAANFPHVFALQREADARQAELEREQAAEERRVALARRHAESKHHHAARHWSGAGKKTSHRRAKHLSSHHHGRSG